MRNSTFIFLLLALMLLCACESNEEQIDSEKYAWKLGWSVIESTLNGQQQLANTQFDSLLTIMDSINVNFLASGLEVKHVLGLEEEVDQILREQSEANLRSICPKPFLAEYQACGPYRKEQVENEELQRELIKMYIDDQAARGNLEMDLIMRYQIDSSSISKKGSGFVDEQNQTKLKSIIREYGFPSRSMVGRDAMFGIFLIIQHSDGDKEWQKSQLAHIEKAVANGDLNAQSFAYLYDRIHINSGQKQRYGTQFSKVDPINKQVILAPTEDSLKLDERRMDIGLMPVEMYKRITLNNI